MGYMPNDAATDVLAARQVLALARADLDAAVASMPDVDGDEAMATPTLLALLLQAVTAKGHLSALEIVLTAQQDRAKRPARLTLIS
jgi:hypothetical protein